MKQKLMKVYFDVLYRVNHLKHKKLVQNQDFTYIKVGGS